MDEGIVHVPLLGTIEAEAGFLVIASQNPAEFVATGALSEALLDRFELVRSSVGHDVADPTTLPPSSVIILYWAGGAFLMTAKRLSEYSEIVASHGKDLLARYRASFAGYTETSLTVSCFVYALASSFVLAVFLMKYRIEYLLIAPVVIALFAHYLALSMQPGSSAQKPEKLIRERGLMALVALLTALFVLLTFVNVPALEPLAGQKYISIQ